MDRKHTAAGAHLGSMSVLQGIFLLIVLSTFFLIRYGYRKMPLERDEGMYIYTGAQIVSGAVPYVDIMEAKPPGLFLTYAVLYTLAAGQLELMHVLMALIATMNTLLVFLVARNLIGTGPALTSAVTFSALSMSLQASGFTMQSEHLVIGSSFTGILLVLLGLRQQRAWYLFFAGALLMWSTLIKQNGLFFIGFALSMMALTGSAANGTRVQSMHILALLFGSLLTLLAPLVWLLHAGAWEGMRTWLGEVAAHYVSRISPAAGMELFQERFIALLKDNTVGWVIGLAGIAVLVSTRGHPRNKRTALLLVAFSILAILPGFRFFGHYFLMLFPALAIASGWVAHHLSSRIGQWWTDAAVGPFQLCFAAVVLVAVMAEQWRPFFRPDPTAILRYVYTTNPFPEAELVAKEINDRSQVGDELLVMGFEPQIYLYTGMKAPTRWLNLDILLYDHPIADQARSEFTRTVTERPPRFVVWVQHMTSWMPPPDADQTFLAEYWEQLRANYEVVAWYEQSPPMQLRSVVGEAAAHHVPSTDLFMFLAVRKEPRTIDP